MAVRYIVRAKTATASDGKGIFSTIGRVMDSKSGLMLKLDVIPTSWEGFCYLKVPLPGEEGPEEE